MKLFHALSPIRCIFSAFRTAFLPTCAEVVNTPQLLFNPSELSRIFFAKRWASFGDTADALAREVKADLIGRAEGVLLDVGAAGHGHSIAYIDPSRVHTYIAVEPNVLMHPFIQEKADAMGYHEASDFESKKRCIILPYGAEDLPSITTRLAEHNIEHVDTILTVHSLCSIPNPSQVLQILLTHLLKPHGRLLFYEHVLSDDPDMAFWQHFWTPVWKRCFGGCRLDVPTHLTVESMTTGEGEGEFWKEKVVWSKLDESEQSLFCHRIGSYSRGTGA